MTRGVVSGVTFLPYPFLVLQILSHTKELALKVSIFVGYLLD